MKGENKVPTMGKLIRHGGWLLFLLFLCGCEGDPKPVVAYHAFDGHSWGRFDKITFSPAVEKPGEVDVVLFACFTPGFSYETLDFNMVMSSPAGEERIREYRLKVKDAGGAFLRGCTGDSCYAEISLKKGMRIGKPGKLSIEIENLTPRITTEGMLGLGIRLERSAK